MRLKILFEEDYVKMLEKKRKRRSQNRKWHFPRSVYFRKKMVGYRTRCEERERGGSRYLERIRFYCQHEHKLQKNTFGRGVARTPSRIEAIYERRLSKYP